MPQPFINPTEFTIEEDLSLCRRYVQFYPRRGEERRQGGIMSMSYLGKIHEKFCADTGNPNNRHSGDLFCRIGSINGHVQEFVHLTYLVNQYRLRGETNDEIIERSLGEWRRWKRSRFRYEAHFRILRAMERFNPFRTRPTRPRR